MSRRSHKHAVFLVWISATTSAIVLSPVGASAQQQGPAIVPRSECEPSIHEGPSGRESAGFRRDVTPLLGLLPASYDWFAGVARAIGSFFQPQAIDPKFLGYLPNPQPYFFSRKGDVSRLYPGFKGIGGKDVTDVPKLGVPGRECPGDPYWVAFPRPGNVEIPPPYQLDHHDWDCFCRYDEKVACPTGAPPPLGMPLFRPGPNLHRVYGGTADFIECYKCFGEHNIRKHDYLIGTRKGPHFGYPSMAGDSGYRECLTQSVESFAGSGPGGTPRGKHLYGL